VVVKQRAKLTKDDDFAAKLAKGKKLEWQLSWLYRVIFLCAVVALAVSFCLGYYGFTHPIDLKATKTDQWPLHVKWQLVILLGWMVIPPLFFWIEYFGIYRRTRGYNLNAPPPKDWEMFKYAQDISAKIWIAVTTALLILYFGKDISPK
jgi:amino acid transporter